MGLKYYSNEFNNSNEIQSLSSDINIPIYSNTSVLSNKKYQTQLSPSETYMSIRNYKGMIYHLEKNIYENISILPTNTSQVSSYTTLMNTTSTSNTNSQVLDENTNSRTYENIKLRSSSSSPIYINLNNQDDKSIIEQKEESSIHSIETKQIDIETNVLPKRNTKQTIEKFEVNIVPCSNKNEIHRTKIPRIPSSLHRRRTLNRPRRYRRRSSTPFRANNHSNATRRRQQQHHHHHQQHSMNSNNRRKRSTHKSVSNQLYNQIESSIICDEEKLFEYPLEFLSHPPENEQKEELIQQVNKPKEEEEEFYTHKTFEDFLLRRRPKSSSSTLASVTNTIISSESLSSDIPPPRPPPLNHHLSGVALSLDKKDVDFIHDIIQRTHGDHRVSNRITALKEAYVHAANKRNDLLKTKQKVSEINNNNNQAKKKATMRQSVIASKIRNELEKYDVLPAHRKKSFHGDDDEDEDEDETYSTNNGNYRYHHHRRLPPIPSTTHRIMNFMTTLKRQLQKNFHDIRSRILIETMSNSRHKHHTFHHTSRPTHRSRTSHHNVIPRSTSHHSMEHSYPFHQQKKFSRAHSNISQISDKHRPRTFRVTPHLQR